MNAPLQTMTSAPDRTKYIGGSDVAAILGISPWKTTLDLYLDKITPPTGEPDRNKARIFSRGKRLEPYVLDVLAEEESLNIVERGQRYIDPCGFIAAEIDAEYFDEKLQSVQNIEIKTSFFGKDFGDAGGDDIPVYYTAQAMHGLMVTNRQVCVFGVMIGVDDFRVYRIERDDETIAAIRARETAFWHEHILAKVPPEPSSGDDVARMFAQDSGTSIECDSAILGMFNELVYFKDVKKRAESDIEYIEDKIKLFMRDASALTLDGKPLLTWKTQATNRFNQREFAEANPELFEQFKRTSESRVFRLK